MAIRNRAVFLWGAVLGTIGVLVIAGQAAVRAAPRPGGYSDVTVLTSSRTATVVLHALDRGGFCDAAAFGAVSQHPVLTNAPNDTLLNPVTGLSSPRTTVDFFIDSGDGVITGSSAGTVVPGGRSAVGIPTYSIFANAMAAQPIRSFPPLIDGAPDECQAWVTVTGAPGAAIDLLVILHDDLGDIGFDRVIKFSTGTDLDLAYRWNLVTWPGRDGVPPQDALSGTGLAAGGDNVSDRVTAIYARDASSGKWLAFFPLGATPTDANDLSELRRGQAYWIAIRGPGPIRWRVADSP